MLFVNHFSPWINSFIHLHSIRSTYSWIFAMVIVRIILPWICLRRLWNTGSRRLKWKGALRLSALMYFGWDFSLRNRIRRLNGRCATPLLLTISILLSRERFREESEGTRGLNWAVEKTFAMKRERDIISVLSKRLLKTCPVRTQFRLKRISFGKSYNVISI
mgnify:CR=1 FL=1